MVVKRCLALGKSKIGFLNPESDVTFLYCAAYSQIATLGEVSTVPLMHHDACDLGLTCLVKRGKPVFGLKNTNLVRFQKKRTLVV